MAPSWVSRGLHSESGGGRGLTARMLSVLIKDYQFRICLSTTFYHFGKIFLCAETKAVNQRVGRLWVGGAEAEPNEKAPSWVARGLHSEGLAAGGDSPPGCCLC
jgi:hypothetical protein